MRSVAGSAHTVRVVGFLCAAVVTIGAVGASSTLPATAVSSTLTPTPRYVTAMYEDFLERYPTATALEYWTHQLVSGSASRATFVRHLADSDESTRVQVRDLYHADLRRDPSAAALAERVGQLRSHQMTARNLDALLVASDEYLARNHLTTTTQWVGRLYARLVGWTPTSAQLSRWVAAASAHGRYYVANVFEQSLNARRAAVRAIQLQLLGYAGSDFDSWVRLDTSTNDLTVKSAMASTREVFDGARPVTVQTLFTTDFSFTAGVSGDALLSTSVDGPVPGLYFTSSDLPAGLSIVTELDGSFIARAHLVGTVATPGDYTARVQSHAAADPLSWVTATTTITVHVAT